MDDERLPKRLFYGDVATGSRRQGGQIRRYKDTLKSSLKRLQINPTNWEELARDLRNAAAQPLPTCPRCQRTFQARIRLVGYLWTNCASRTAPTIVPTPASYSSSLSPTNSDNSSVLPLPSSSTAPTAAARTVVSHITNPHTTTDNTPTSPDPSDEDQDYTCPHCDRTFTSRIGLPRHTHPAEPHIQFITTNHPPTDIDATDFTTPHSSPSSSSSSFTATTAATPASVAHDITTATPDTTTGITPATSVIRGEDQDYTCPHCDRTFTSRIGLVGHLRIHCIETDEPVPGAPTYTHRTRLHCPHCPRTFTHCMGLFGHMRIHESGIDHNSETPTTSNTSTMPSTTPAPSPCSLITTTTTTASSAADTADFSCPHCPRTFTSRIGLVGHLRIHHTESGEPVPGAPTYTHQARLNCPHCPRTFRHRMGLFGHMRIHDDLR
nr:unnamed protein product [Spirometra erinaceieuropaei]